MKSPKTDQVKLVLLSLAGACLALNACTCESGKMMEAAKEFAGFAKGDPAVTDPLGQKKKKNYTNRSWKEENVNNRHRAVADVEVKPQISPSALEKVLRDAVHDDGLQRSTSAVMVRAWPGKLKKTMLPLGIGIFARDGHGWEGTGVGFEKIHVLILPVGKAKKQGIQPLTEDEYLMVLGVDNMLQRGQAVDQAQKLTAERHEVPLERIKAAYQRAQKIRTHLEKGIHAAVGPSGLR